MRVKLQKPSKRWVLPVASGVALLVAVLLVLVPAISQPKITYVLVAVKDLAEGQVLQAGDVRQMQLPLGDLGKLYPSKLKVGLNLARSIAKGQLIAKRDLVRSNSDLVPIRLNNLKPISKAISIGDSVDIWASDLSPSNTSSPEPIAFGALVTGIEVNNSMSDSSTSVELRVDRNFVESILAAYDSRFQISLILNATLADE